VYDRVERNGTNKREKKIELEINLLVIVEVLRPVL
jgi:hypothetical protein